MSKALFSPLVERAMRVAAAAHRHHHRKGSDLPYITHPMHAALILLRAGIDDEEILAAALLHDVVEDTDHTLELLATEFPPRIVRLVAALTERKLDHVGRKRSWLERKEEQLRQIAAEPWEARAIVLADKLHNLGSMRVDLEHGADVWSRFNAPSDRVLWYHREMVAAAFQEDPRLSKLANECLELVEHLANQATGIAEAP
jgi:(p)ppGpp synthase/HD superfamily hydrolase